MSNPKLSDALYMLADHVEDAPKYMKKEMTKRISRRSPVDEGTLRDSWDWDEDGIYTTDDPGKVMALEFGHSDQAPNGFVRSTLNEAEDIAEEYRSAFRTRGRRRR